MEKRKSEEPDLLEIVPFCTPVGWRVILRRR